MSTVRITIPEGMEPMLYLQQLGSPRLREASQGLWAALFLNDSTVTPREREAGRYYMAYLVDCERCGEFRAARDLPGYATEEIEDAFYDNIADWRTYPGYTTRERLVIEFYEAVLFDHERLANDDAMWERLNANFTQTEIEDLSLLAATASAQNKLREVLLGAAPVCAQPSQRAS